MPYITKKDRKDLHKSLGNLNNPGKLNYKITDLIDIYIFNKGLSYQTINDIVGALEGAKLEFYRRIAVPYENNKLSINGDVYWSDNET